MVQKSSRRSSLIMGVLLALLLGVAAAFFVLAMPIHMLETVTTMTRLSKLMVQAEPPISPNDRTLLSILAGVMTAGIGWVMVDWLIFGRAGMGLLIRSREDDYEDEDEDHFRPTDPLDLVAPGAPPAQDWAMPQAGDARRPLSARTDIGDPPTASPFDVPFPVGGETHRPLPPIGGILPGAGVSPPPLQPNVPPPPLAQPAPHFPARPMASPHGVQDGESIDGLGFPAVSNGLTPRTEDTPPSPSIPPAAMPSWLPAPGSRPDDRGDAMFGPLVAGPEEPPSDEEAVLHLDEPSILPPISPRVVPPLIDIPPMSPVEPLDFDQSASGRPIGSQPEPDVGGPPFFSEAPAPAAPAPKEPARAEVRPPFEAAPPRPTPHPVQDAGFDKARLEDLLSRLERGLQQRRARSAPNAAAPAPTTRSASTAPVASVPPERPVETPVETGPRMVPPAAFAAPMFEEPAPFAEPPSEFLEQLSALPPVFDPASTYVPPVAADPVQTGPSVSQAGSSANDEFLDQPLHVALDRLRNMVRR